MCSIRKVTVVFPLVPVIPIIFNRDEGLFKAELESSANAFLVSSTKKNSAPTFEKLKPIFFGRIIEVAPRSIASLIKSRPL
jgi:hypothetical protein